MVIFSIFTDNRESSQIVALLQGFSTVTHILSFDRVKVVWYWLEDPFFFLWFGWYIWQSVCQSIRQSFSLFSRSIMKLLCLKWEYRKNKDTTRKTEKKNLHPIGYSRTAFRGLLTLLSFLATARWIYIFVHYIIK